MSKKQNPMAPLAALVLGISSSCLSHGAHHDDCASVSTDGAPGGTSSSVYSQYMRWSQAHSRGIAARQVEVPLRFAKGISVQQRELGGHASIDLDAGSVEAEVNGLEEPAELWLIDNRPGASALPDPGDDVLRVGRLEPVEGSATLTSQIGARLPGGFEIDRVIVAREGQGPMSGILLMGSTDTFERLYAMQERSDLAPGSMQKMLDGMVTRGRELFERETFLGNGRSCATCHPLTNNFTIDPRFIASLPDDDPLFIAEQVPALAQLENPLLLRQRGLILENLDGFDRPGVFRGVPPTLGLATSIRGPEVPFDNTANPAFGIVPPAQRTGWSGDGAPGSGSLRDFAIGAVIQHFPRSLARVEGQDFRLPTDEELDALEVFQLSLGRTEELDLAELEFLDPVVQEGERLFNRLDTVGGTVAAGKCALCHDQAGANIDSAFFSNLLGAQVSGNANFGTGVNDLEALPGDLLASEELPRDGGFARVPHDGLNCTPARGGFGTVTPPGGILPAGLCEEDFNTPPLVEAADTGPFFHNNAVDTLEGAVAFYNDDAFNDSPGGQILASLDSANIGIDLDTSEVGAIANFLRVVNALENIRESLDLIQRALCVDRLQRKPLLRRLEAEILDAIEVLEGAGLHPDAVLTLRKAAYHARCVNRSFFSFSNKHHLKAAAKRLRSARGLLVLQPGE